MNKNRELLKRMGMLKEFDEWKQNLSKTPTFPPPVGTRVRFKTHYGHPFEQIEKGTEGLVVPNDWERRENEMVGVRPVNWRVRERAHISERDFNRYLEYI